MANNDPIKEYNSIDLKLERLKEKSEMASIGDDPITDLHDCSNDLSDSGSKKEEIEHAKFSYEIRQKINKKEYKSKDVWSSSKNETVINPNKKFMIFVIILISISFAFPVLFFIVGNLIGSAIMDVADEFMTDYINESQYVQEVYGDENLTEDNFEEYLENIDINMNKMQDNNIYMQINNTNERSISNVNVEIVFLDANYKVLKVCKEYIDILIGNNMQFFNIYDAPKNFSSFQYTIEKGYDCCYSEMSTKNVILTTEKILEDGYYDTKVSIQNNTGKKLNSVEFVIVYLKDEEMKLIETQYMFDIETGEKEYDELCLFKYNEFDEAVILINDIDIY